MSDKPMEDRVEELERSIVLFRRLLLGPDEEALRATDAGLVRIVFDLSEDAKRKKAINKFLLSVASFLGLTNLAGIIAFIIWVSGGQ